MEPKVCKTASSNCRQPWSGGAWRRMSLALLLVMLTTMTARADDVNLAEDGEIAVGTAGHYYVNMPATGTNTLTLTDASVTTFKVYDDGGKGGKYSNGCDGTLVLTAPTGYLLQLSGSVTTDGSNDKLTVYDGSKENGTTLGAPLSGTVSDINKTSTGNVITLNFISNTVFDGIGFDLTVTLVVAPTTDYNVTVNLATGGSVVSDPTSAKIGETVTLTATPDDGYLLSGISVTYGNNNAVAVTGGKWYDNTATFTMHGSNVTVTPTFTNKLTAEDGLYINMPVTEDQTLEIPSSVQSFKVYDDGGKDNNHSKNCTGTLVLTAPAGYLLQLSGSITTDLYDYLTVYDGSITNDKKLLNAVRSTSSDTETDIPTVISTGNVMTIYFNTNNFYEYAGLDLKVTVVNTNAGFEINGLGSSENGSIAASVGGVNATTANVNDVVTLTATPESDYLLSGISVKDANNSDVAVTWDGLLSNTATFTMPASNVTVTPTFTNNLTNLSVNMPVTGSKSITIPSYVQSFKVYDDGGSSGEYSINCDGYLVLTAPEDYKIQLSGSITTEWNQDMLTVYGNSEPSGTPLLNPVSSSGSGTKTDIPLVTSTGNVMTLKFVSNGSFSYAGLDLTVTLVNPNADYNVTVNSADNGSIAASVGGENATTAKANEVVTLTANPADGYLPSGFSVTFGNNNAVPVTWDGPFSNTATFTMPGSNVTVTPTFTDNLTADNGLYINMPATGSKELTIPSGVESFKVYDDGGKDGKYSDNYEGTLVLTAPAGYVLRLSGSIDTEGFRDYLTVYDNNAASGNVLLKESGTKSGITTVSTSKVMTLHFSSDKSANWSGLDLTVTLVVSMDYEINGLGSAGNGSIAASVGGTNATTAKEGRVVTLTANPANGYLLSAISVKDANNSDVTVTWEPFSNTATFAMPASAVTVTPTFTKNIASCTVTVPNQTLGTYTCIYEKFSAANSDLELAATMDVGVKDGETPLVLGTDYSFGDVYYSNNTGKNEPKNVGDECKVEIVGKGNYAGTTYGSFKIIASDTGGKWGNSEELTWAFHDGTLTISPTENAQLPVAMKETTLGDYPWSSIASYIQTITISEGVASIAANAFAGTEQEKPYSNVTTISLPSTLTAIGDNAFAYCTGATITIPESVTTLGENPFNQVGCVEISKTLVDGVNSDMISKIKSAKRATFTYQRNFLQDVATVCLPFDYTQGPEEGTYYTFTGIDKTKKPWEVIMTSTTTSLEANKPYMFVINQIVSTTITSFTGTASSFVINSSSNSVDDPLVEGGKWNFIGTYESRVWDAENNADEIGSVYGFAAKREGNVKRGDFAKAKAGASIAPFRAYLKFTPPSQGARRRSAADQEALPSTMSVRFVNADGSVTAIGTIDTSTGNVSFDNDAWYSLDGRRHNSAPSTRSVYIKKGKKVVGK